MEFMYHDFTSIANVYVHTPVTCILQSLRGENVDLITGEMFDADLYRKSNFLCLCDVLISNHHLHICLCFCFPSFSWKYLTGFAPWIFLGGSLVHRLKKSFKSAV